MKQGSSVMKVLIFVVFTVQLASAASHSLQYLYTGVTSGTSLPEFTLVGLLDGEQIMYYDSNIQKMIPKTEWMKKLQSDDPQSWNRNTRWAENRQEDLKTCLADGKQCYSHTEGVHTVQWMFGCELHEDGTETGYDRYGYDGEDYLSLDLDTLTWTAANPKADLTKPKWGPNGEAKHVKDYLLNECPESIKKYVQFRSTLERKVPPEVSLFQKDSSSPVVCHATGFFPKEVMISWQKNGQDLEEDVDLRETVPNEDGTFQKRSALTVTRDELHRNEYSCVIQHAGLKDKVLQPAPREVCHAKGFFYKANEHKRFIRSASSDKLDRNQYTCIVPNCSPERQMEYSGTHSLKYFYTAVTPGIDFPEFTIVGLVDEGQFVYYDSDISKMIPKTEWIKKNDASDPDYWNRETQKQLGAQEIFKAAIVTAMQRFNQTKGVHAVQYMYGCELNDDETKSGYEQLGYDGEDFISLDLKTATYVAPNPKALITKNKWDAVNEGARLKAYLEGECIEWLQKYVGYGRSTLERKVRPEVDLFQKDSSSPVMCHATGFFPKAVMISWQKNGEDLHEDFELRETTPNDDGTFQKRSVLTVSPEKLDSDKYTCVIQHGALDKEVVLQVSDRRVLSGGGSVGIIIGVIVVALVVLVVIVGVVVWKKKKSGFKPVPPNPSPPSDTSSNNS